MRTFFGGDGLIISLNRKDKEKIEKKGILECRLLDWKKPKLTLHLVDKVTEKGGLENPGFHIEVNPPKTSPEHRTHYNIYLCKKRFYELTHPENQLECGYFVSRSIYDRVDFTYWDL